MNRSRDLDTIAPDDLIILDDKIIEEEPEIKDKPIKKKVKKKSKRHSYRNKAYDILGSHKHSFSSFMVNPDKFDFIEREKSEEILLTVRAHWFVNLKWLAIAIAMCLVPLSFGFLDILNSIPFKYQLVSVLFWYLITFVYSFEKFLDWYFDIFIVTNKRLVDIKFNNLLNKHFAEADIGVIQDVSSSVKGILGTFLNAGTVLVQTAAETNQIIFKNIPYPERVIKLLQELRNQRSGGIRR